MLRFKEFLAEMFLLEGKIDDLKAQNPSLHREIDQYAAADPTSTKKFVPWLVSQHKRGNVTPDHPDLHQVLGNYDRYKNIHGIKDHASKTFQEVHSTIMPLIGTGSTKAEIANQGHVKIHDSGDVQAYHVANKEASQKFYGGGPEAGLTNTRWCVSARSEDCLYEKSPYGKLYTIHVKGDPNSPYAVHPGHENKISGSITNRHNDGDNEIDDELKSNPKIARLKPAIDAIRKHYEPLAFRLANDHDLTKDEIDIAMSSSKYQKHLLKNPHSHIAMTALNHPKAGYQTTWRAAQHQDPQVAMAALNHPKADFGTTHYAAQHHDPQVAMAALNHPKADSDTTWKAAQHANPQVALAALNHPEADTDTTWNAAQHHDPQVTLAALNHPKVDYETTWKAARHANPQVALAALNHPKADSDTTWNAAKHHDPQVAMAALNHPKADSDTTWNAAEHANPKVAMAALNHPKADSDTTWNAAQHHDPQVAMAALNHPKADSDTTWNAAQHHDPQVAMAALNHPEADTDTTWNAAKHHDPQVAMAALNHPKANSGTIQYAAQHQDPQVRTKAQKLLAKFK